MIEPNIVDDMNDDSFSTETASEGVVRAAAVLAIGNVASRVLGLARETVKANLFGASGFALTYAAFSATIHFW